MRALLVVDVQNDFMPWGAFPVIDGDHVIPLINRLMELPFDHIVACKDWHPTDHGSFAVNHGKNIGDHILLDGLDQILWPVHCVQNTSGADFPKGLHAERIEQVVYKGTDWNIDSYGAFYDNGHRKSTGLASILREQQIEELYVVGLATEYCVKFSVLDAIKEGFKTFLVQDAVKGINLRPGDSEGAVEEMRRAGAVVVESTSILF